MNRVAGPWFFQAGFAGLPLFPFESTTGGRKTLSCFGVMVEGNIGSPVGGLTAKFFYKNLDIYAYPRFGPGAFFGGSSPPPKCFRICGQPLGRTRPMRHTRTQTFATFWDDHVSGKTKCLSLASRILQQQARVGCISHNMQRKRGYYERRSILTYNEVVGYFTTKMRQDPDRQFEGGGHSLVWF